MHSPTEPYPEVTISSSVPVPDPVTETAVRSLVNHILRLEGISGAWELGVEFVDDATMQAAHAEFMDIDEPTDIMTFPYEDVDDFGPDIPGGYDMDVRGGDLMISVDRAAENAVSARWGTDDELFFLIAHGMLHLLGWDDGTEEERDAMLARQSALITSWRATPEAMR